MSSSPPPRVVLDSLSVVALRLGIIGLVGYGLLLVWGRLSFILLPFAVALLLTALLEPVTAAIHRRLRLPRWIAAMTTVLGTIALVAGTLTWIAPDIFRQAEEITNQVEEGVRQLPDVLRDLGLKDNQIQDFVGQLTDELQKSVGDIGKTLSTGALSAAQGVASVFASVFLALIMLIYLLIDGQGFWRGALRFVPPARRAAWTLGGQRAWRAVTLFVRSQVLVAAIDGVGIAIGLLILGVPLAVPLGILTFLLAFLPYIGAILAGVAVALVALASGGLGDMIGAIVVVVIVQQIESNVLYPLLIGRTVRLHPLTVLLGVGAGSALLGIVGAFLATPIIAAVSAGAGWLDDSEAEDAANEATARTTVPEEHEERDDGPPDGPESPGDLDDPEPPDGG
ncbi:MAG: AI-2E family transporter [Solirubrobacteraceae bacterium]|nr:AI-2E family transporter [Solirubrobacteraceae bacterium]